MRGQTGAGFPRRDHSTVDHQAISHTDADGDEREARRRQTRTEPPLHLRERDDVVLRDDRDAEARGHQGPEVDVPPPEEDTVDDEAIGDHTADTDTKGIDLPRDAPQKSGELVGDLFRPM